MSDETTLPDSLDEICSDMDSLPEDWQILLTFQGGMLDVELLNPEGEIVNVADPINEESDDITRRMIRRRINYARRSDGLGAEFDIDDGMI